MITNICIYVSAVWLQELQWKIQYSNVIFDNITMLETHVLFYKKLYMCFIVTFCNTECNGYKLTKQHNENICVIFK